jgi:hypothetical protein
MVEGTEAHQFLSIHTILGGLSVLVAINECITTEWI